MVFSSISFLFVFLPIVLLVYYLIDGRFKNTFLLFASLFFYFWGEPKFFPIMILSIAVNYLGGILIGSLNNHKILMRLALCVSIIFNLGLLGIFKYLDFSIGILNDIFKTEIPLRGILLPIGISFFTFQGMSYVIDVYRGDVKAQRNPLKLGLYIAMFPQLIAGPIVRYIDIEKEIDSRKVNLSTFYCGVERFIIGLSKKVIIANRAAEVSDRIFDMAYGTYDTPTAWLGIILYTVQIYFDFSGYSDMAIGLGKMFGFTFMENFDYPYISKSITEFWRRWHISLSSWFRDYLYIPLGGNRKGNVYINLLIVFICTGLWHGASLNFLIWGLWHGAFILIERVIKNHRKVDTQNKNCAAEVAKHIYTLLVVMIGWVFFKADTLTESWKYLKTMFGFTDSTGVYYTASYFTNCFIIVILIAGILAAVGLLEQFYEKMLASDNQIVRRTAFIVYNVILMGLLLVSCIFVINSTYNPFIYFRF